MSGPGDSMHGPRPAPDHDDQHNGAPMASSAETPSGLIVRAATTAVRLALEQRGEGEGKFAAAHPAVMRGIRAVGRGLGYLAVAVLGATGVVIVDQPEPGVAAVEQAREPDCDPAVLRYILHMATAGEALAIELEDAGEIVRARLVRDMTDVNKLPNDLQLCVLLANRTGPTP